MVTVVVALLAGPLLGFESPSPGPDRQLALAQLVAAVAATGLAGAFGVFALDQLDLARYSIQQSEAAIRADQESRGEADRRAEREVLLALTLELHNNRLSLFHYEGRLKQRDGVATVSAFPIRQSVFMGAATGPLWRLKGVAALWPVLARAYGAASDVSIQVHPIRWVLMCLVGVPAAFFEDSGRRKSLVTGAALGLLWLFGSHTNLRVTGQARMARGRPEEAIELVNAHLGNGPIDWATHDNGMETYELVPEATPGGVEQALAWFARTLHS